MGDPRSISTKIAQQFGYVTREQLLDAGLGAGAIDYRIRTGELIVEHAGVYAVKYRRREPIAKAAAAVLACGKGAALSNSSAAVLWDMFKRWPDPPEVTVPGDRRRPKIKTHRRKLERRDIRTQRGIRCTSPARTALDIAPRLTDDQLARAIEQTRLAGWLSNAELLEIVDRLPHHRGAGRLRRVIEGLANAPTRSKFERLFLNCLRRYGLPTPQVNVRIMGKEVDFLFERERVIVELDGYETHGTRASFERDRERDAVLLAAGYVTIRITWERFKSDPQREAARLLQILEQQRAVAA